MNNEKGAVGVEADFEQWWNDVGSRVVGNVDGRKELARIGFYAAASRTAEQKRSEYWIPVSESLPEGIPQVLVSWQNVIEMAYYINGIWYDDDDNEMVFGMPEAWQLLPKPYVAR